MPALNSLDARPARIVFRVAAGPRLGFGHLMRARSLARSLGIEPALSVRGGVAARRAARALGWRIAEGDPLSGADLLVVDDPSARHGRAWIARARRRGVPAVSIHDGAHGHKADLTVLGSLLANERAAAPPRALRELRGVRFYILDTRIQALRAIRRRRALPRRPRVLVALGGGEHVVRLAGQIVHSLQQSCGPLSISVAAGFSAGVRPALTGARWITATRGLAAALGSADIAVVAGGVTLHEACALGVPAVGLAVVPAQRPAIRAFARRKAILDAGGTARSGAAIRRAASGVARIAGDASLRSALGAAGRTIVDGRGAARVARHVLGLLARTGRPHA